MDRRQLLQGLAGAAALTTLDAPRFALAQHQNVPPAPVEYDPPVFTTDETNFLDEVEERAAQYFWQRADKSTGLVFDRASADGGPSAHVGIGAEFQRAASIAASGFGLSALVVAADRNYIAASNCEQRMYAMLDFFANRAQHVHGFFYHYVDVATGARIAKYELSSIDTALLLCGILHARDFLNSSRADALARTIYDRVNWEWMMNGGPTLAMGWTPEDNFIQYRWSSYCESTLMYMMAIGSPTHPIAPEAWDKVERNPINYGGVRFITSYGAIFIHQYAHLWADLRGVKDRHTNYFQNSIAATRAHKTFCMQQHGKYGWVDESCWGYSAADNRHGGYTVWAGPPSMNNPEGTLAPHSAGGSLMLLGPECLAVLVAMRQRYPKSFARYGFVDSFRPDPGNEYYDRDVIGIDVGLIMLAAENLRSASVWKRFMKNREITDGMRLAGFQRDPHAACA